MMMGNHTRAIRRSLLVAGLGLLPLIGVAAPGRAAMDADVRAEYHADVEGFGVGGGLLTGVGREGRWFFNPNVEVAFGDAANEVLINGDFHHDFPVASPTSYWLGAGPALLIRDRERGDTSTDIGVNLMGGLGAKRGDVRPFAQVKGVLADNSQVILAAGIRF